MFLRKSKSYVLIDFTDSYIVIQEYPDQVILDSSFDDLPVETWQQPPLWNVYRRKVLQKFQKKSFVGYRNLSFEKFITALNAIEKKQLGVERKGIVSIPPNSPKEDIESLRDVLELFSFDYLLFFDRMAAIISSSQIKDNNYKTVVFYITQKQCYQAIYFHSGIYNVKLLNADHKQITNQTITAWALDLKNKIIEFPKDFSVLKKKQKNAFNQLKTDWQKNYEHMVHVFLEDNVSLKNLDIGHAMRIHRSTGKQAMSGLKRMVENLQKKEY